MSAFILKLLAERPTNDCVPDVPTWKNNYSLVGKYVKITYRVSLQRHIRFMTSVIGVHPKRD